MSLTQAKMEVERLGSSQHLASMSYLQMSQEKAVWTNQSDSNLWTGLNEDVRDHFHLSTYP